MKVKKRRVYTAEFKAKVGLEAVRGVKTVTEIAQESGVHPVLLCQWKKEILWQQAHGRVPARDGCSGLMYPDTNLGENARHGEVFDD